jgi:NAD(P)-dependent dehydrogenase (short-subunit alcohol dehydrogenase family)
LKEVRLLDYGLKDKVVLIMGGSSGVGFKTAEMFLQEGAKVVIGGRDPYRLDEAAKKLERFHAKEKVLAKKCDVTIENDVKEVVKAAIQKFHQLDVLVNSAGRSVMGHFFDITNDQWEEQIKLKYHAIIFAVRAAYPYMKEQGGGRIININATLSKEPEPHMVATAATRAGLLNLSKSLAHELAADNILVNSVSLGVIQTDQWERRRLQNAPDMEPEAYYEDLAKKRSIPLGRVGKAEEVASAILYLASSGASYVTGTTIEVAGGIGKAL